MAMTLVMDYSKCHGCQICEIACSMIGKVKNGTSKPRVTSFTWDLEGRGVSIICRHCEDAPCMTVCPKGAIYRYKELNRVTVNYKLCIGCRICVAVCPFGAMEFDGQTRKVIKCDLCDGDPLCSKLCPYDALQYVDLSHQSIVKRTETARKPREMLLTGKGRNQ